MKWNERERQKSFVVVEENPSKPKKYKKRQQPINSGLDEALCPKVDENSDEEQDEISDEEDDHFDIDDSSPDVDIAPVPVVNPLSPQEKAVAADKIRESQHQDRVVANLKREHRRTSRSRSRSRVSSTRMPSSAHQQPSPRHVGFEVPFQNDSGLLHSAQHGPRQDMYLNRPSSGKSCTSDHDSEEFAPVMHNRTRTRSSSRLRDQQHGPRAFAVWGNDESDSNASDSDSISKV